MKQCKKCGGHAFYADGKCKPCKQRMNARWKANNLERHAAAIRAWKLAHPEAVKASNKQSALKHPEAGQRAAARRRLNNPDSLRRASNGWKARNLEACRIINHNRLAKLRENGGVLSKNIVSVLMEQQAGICALCKQPLDGAYHIDHKIPVSLGGANEDWNVQLLHPVCNMKKGSKHPNNFI